MALSGANAGARRISRAGGDSLFISLLEDSTP